MAFDPQKLTEKANRAIVLSQKAARAHSNVELAPAHLALALFSEPDVSDFGVRICQKSSVEAKEVVAQLLVLVKALPTQSPAPDEPSPNRAFRKLLDAAESLRGKQGDSFVAVDHLLVALTEEAAIASALIKAGLPKEKLVAAIKGVRGDRKVTSSQAEQNYDALNKYGQDLVKRAEDGKLDPVIGRDDEVRRVVQVLSRRTKNNPVLVGEPGVGKTAIVEGLAQRIVSGDVPANLHHCRVYSLDMGALMAGASHVGEFEERLKSVLKEVEDSNGQIVLFIDELHIVLGAGRTSGAMDAANLLKPMLARGTLRCIGATTLEEYRKYVEKDAAFERRFQKVQVSEPTVPDTVSILRGLKERYETHHGVRIQDAALVAAAQLSSRYIQGRFLPDKAIDLVDEACASTRVQLDSQPEIMDQLERRKLQLEVESTALEREKDAASKQRLQSVKQEIARIDETLRPLQMQYQSEKERFSEINELKRKLEEVHQKIQRAERNKDLALAADLKFGAVPDLEKRITELTNQLKDESEQHKSTRLLTEIVGPEQIAEIVARWTGIPVKKLNESESQRLLKLGKRLHRRVVGQEEAVDAVANAILRSRSGLGKEGRPLGSFLFLGPTGVGKTELAKALAAELFDNEKHIVRLDMSEYMEQHSVARMIGAPPGYIGHDEGGQLTEAVRKDAYTVVLFDEVEKAHPSVFNVLLQVLDDGRLTDSKGRTVDFSNTVVIMTSNLGSDFMSAPQAVDPATGNLTPTARDKVMASVRAHFRPEFLNRIDDMVMFTPLGNRQLGKIVRLQLAQLAERLRDRDVVLDLTPAAIDHILREAYNPLYGARPLRRWLEKFVVTEISKIIIRGELPNNSVIRIEKIGESAVPSAARGFAPSTNKECGLHFVITPRSPTHQAAADMEDEDGGSSSSSSSLNPTDMLLKKAGISLQRGASGNGAASSSNPKRKRVMKDMLSGDEGTTDEDAEDNDDA